MPFDASNLDEVTQFLVLEVRPRLEEGWCQAAMRQRGAVCYIGSVQARNELEFAAYERLAAAVGAHDLEGARHWNDEPGRTLEDVLAAVDRAIAQ